MKTLGKILVVAALAGGFTWLGWYSYNREATVAHERGMRELLDQSLKDAAEHRRLMETGESDMEPAPKRPEAMKLLRPKNQKEWAAAVRMVWQLEGDNLEIGRAK